MNVIAPLMAPSGSGTLVSESIAQDVLGSPLALMPLPLSALFQLIPIRSRSSMLMS